jgi:hypothetical protein
MISKRFVDQPRMNIAKVAGIDELPSDIIVEIIAKFLDHDSMRNLSLTCRDMERHFSIFSLTAKDPSTGLTIVPITQKMLEVHEQLIISQKVAAGCHFRIVCRNPWIANELLKITGGAYATIGIKIFGDFDVEELKCVPFIQSVEWTVDIKKTKYRKYLEQICSMPRLTRLVINAVGMNAKRPAFNINNIKPIVNAKRIRVIIRLQFRVELLNEITDNINIVTVVVGTKDVHRDKPHTGIEFTGNQILEIEGLAMDNFTCMSFTNVNTVVLKKIKFGECHKHIHSGIYHQPRDLFFDGGLSAPRLNSIRGDDMIGRLHMLRVEEF